MTVDLVKIPPIPQTLDEARAFKMPREHYEAQFDSRGGDGYDRMETAVPHQWRPWSAWGRNGWDLLEWPYYVLYVRKIIPSATQPGMHNPRLPRTREEAEARASEYVYEVATNCEGDVDVWRFPTPEHRRALIDLLAYGHWHMRGERWVEGTDPAARLDEIPEHLRGEYSHKRAGLTG